MIDGEIKALNQLVKKIATELGEHFDSVQILTSIVLDDKKTLSICKGKGDWYARQGLAHEFINREMAQEIAVEIADKQNPPTDDGNAWRQTE